MFDNHEHPLVRIPLGLNVTEGPSMKVLLRRSLKRLKLARSGQTRLNWLVSMEFLGAAKLEVKGEEYVLCARIPLPVQGDLIGYPDVAALQPVDGRGATTEVAAPETGAAVDDARPAVGTRRVGSDDSAASVLEKPPRDGLGVALDALADDLDCIHGEAAANDGSRDSGTAPSPDRASATVAPCSGQTISSAAAQGGGATGLEHADCERLTTGPRGVERGPGWRGDVASLDEMLGYLAADFDLDDVAMRAYVPVTVERLAPCDPDKLPVAEALEGIRRSAGFVGQVQGVMQHSTDIKKDMKCLEGTYGLDSRPSRTFIAAREPEFDIDVAGTEVRFKADPVRTTVGDDDAVINAVVSLARPRGQFDDFKAIIFETVGTGVPGGVTTGGRHDIRFADLRDVQRGVLLILRSAGHKFSLQIKEKISTATLERAPALVIDAGDWDALVELAIGLLQRTRECREEHAASCHPDLPLFEEVPRDDDLEAA